MKGPVVYLLASKRNGTLYIGVTSDLIQRIWQHREGLVDGFTKKYGVKTLVWYQEHETMDSAIGKEKAMKKWPRKWKLSTIEQTNPGWMDLWPEIVGEATPPVVLPHPYASRTQTRCQQDSPPPVVPAKAGTQQSSAPPVVATEAETRHVASELDSRLRGKDGSADVSASTSKLP